MPTAPSNGYAWRGRRACSCVIDAVADYERQVKHPLTIFQACYSFARASAGTHSGGGALDTVSLPDYKIKIASAMGFWPSNRYRSQGFDPHAHWVLFGCPHMHSGLRYQESELRHGRNGLAGRGRDTFRNLRPRNPITYKAWKAKQVDVTAKVRRILKKTPLETLTVAGINRARRGGWTSRYTYYVQKYLRNAGFYKSPLDGKWGQSTQAALNNFRRSLGWKEADSIGPIGMTSLTLLRKAGKGSKRIAP
jgi:hypothetical protein